MKLLGFVSEQDLNLKVLLMSIQLIYSKFVLLTLKLEVLEYQKLSTIEY